MTIDLSTALLRLTGGLLTGAAIWAVTVSLLASWRPTARWAVAMTPRVLRAALFTGVTGIVAISPTRAMADDLDGLPLPDRPVTSTLPDETGHVVRPGQSLWSIATSAAGSEATSADIAEATSHWYLRNRTVIGDDPNLILPGQVLMPPTEEVR
jgi:nucleoid-associated protein YgaU